MENPIKMDDLGIFGNTQVTGLEVETTIVKMVFIKCGSEIIEFLEPGFSPAKGNHCPENFWWKILGKRLGVRQLVRDRKYIVVVSWVKCSSI